VFQSRIARSPSLGSDSGLADLSRKRERSYPQGEKKILILSKAEAAGHLTLRGRRTAATSGCEEEKLSHPACERPSPPRVASAANLEGEDAGRGRTSRDRSERLHHRFGAGDLETAGPFDIERLHHAILH